MKIVANMKFYKIMFLGLCLLLTKCKKEDMPTPSVLENQTKKETHLKSFGRNFTYQQGESVSNIACITHYYNDNNAYTYYKDGSYSIGTDNNLSYYTSNLKYVIPDKNTTSQIVAISDGNGVFIMYFDDGSYQISDKSENYSHFRNCNDHYKIDAGHKFSQILGIVDNIITPSQQYIFYSDGTGIIAATSGYEDYSDPSLKFFFYPAPGKSYNDIVAISLNNNTHRLNTYYTDGTFSQGNIPQNYVKPGMILDLADFDTNFSFILPRSNYGIPCTVDDLVGITFNPYVGSYVVFKDGTYLKPNMDWVTPINNFKKFTSNRLPLSLPFTESASNIRSITIGEYNPVVDIFFKDGMVSSAYYSDNYVDLIPYNYPHEKTIVAIVKHSINDYYTFYSDGTYSKSNTKENLNPSNIYFKYTTAPNKKTSDIISICASHGEFYTHYKDRSFSIGSSASNLSDLGFDHLN